MRGTQDALQKTLQNLGKAAAEVRSIIMKHLLVIICSEKTLTLGFRLRGIGKTL